MQVTYSSLFDEGVVLEDKGRVEVVSSLERDGRSVFKDLRWGVYVVIEAPNDYTAACFLQYGMNTDSSGRYSAMYKLFHLIGLELNISILSAALLNKPTGSTQGFTADVVATEYPHWRILQGELRFWVISQLVSNPSLKLRGKKVAMERLRDMAKTPAETVQAMLYE